MAAVIAALNQERHDMTTHSPPEAVSLAAHGIQLSSTVLAAAVLVMGLMAGVFGLWAHTIMPGLRHTDDRTFVGAFQSLDRAIINPWFMAAFFGALVLTGLAAVLHLSGDKRNVLPWIGTAFVLYLVAVVITLAVNVPLNDAIKAAGDPARIGDLAAVRRHFDEARWSAWNLVRTLTSTAAFGCLVAAAMMLRTPRAG
jgi:uncharacterized membrane protein